MCVKRRTKGKTKRKCGMNFSLCAPGIFECKFNESVRDDLPRRPGGVPYAKQRFPLIGNLWSM